MEKKSERVIKGFILELYRHGDERPGYVSSFDPEVEAGFNSYSENKEESVVFESREALLPLASIEVEAVSMEGDEEYSVYDGFRILPFEGKTSAPLISNLELEAALAAFEE